MLIRAAATTHVQMTCSRAQWKRISLTINLAERGAIAGPAARALLMRYPTVVLNDAF